MKPLNFILVSAIVAEVLLGGACDGGSGGNNAQGNSNNSGYSTGSVEGTLNGNPFFGPTPEGRNCYEDQNTQTGQITVVCY